MCWLHNTCVWALVRFWRIVAHKLVDLLQGWRGYCNWLVGLVYWCDVCHDVEIFLAKICPPRPLLMIDLTTRPMAVFLSTVLDHYFLMGKAWTMCVAKELNKSIQDLLVRDRALNTLHGRVCVLCDRLVTKKESSEMAVASFKKHCKWIFKQEHFWGFCFFHLSAGQMQLPFGFFGQLKGEFRGK